MSEPVIMDQMKLFCDIANAVSKQQKKIPADSRSNAVIKAANIIVEAYGMSNDDFIAKYGESGEKL